MKFTIFGSRGFIGRNLARFLQAKGHAVSAVDRSTVVPAGAHLGHVVYAIGLTADFRGRPAETIDAHVGVMTRLMQRAQFDSWLYLSSTRVYAGLAAGVPATETVPVPVSPSADSLYELSKLLGEAYCLGFDHPNTRVARLSNVYGPDQGGASFLGAVIDEARRAGAVTIREDASSSKDYIAIEDVVALLAGIAVQGKQRLYNVASGASTQHADLARELGRLTGARITFDSNAVHRSFPAIDNARVSAEFAFQPRRIIDDLPRILDQWR
jgi:nucleoside-diphosphate-sugar epimerase